jgi:cyclopropane fatty-acyl-phospholipid synthase-like methyltransferase
MPPNLALARQLLKDPRYPRTCTYDPDWIVSLEMGCPTFWLLESLCAALELEPGMRALDLGCGKAGGSIFLAREYGMQVWAVDLWVNPTENLERIHQAGLEAQVFPLRAEARQLPFAEGFFDVLIAVNSLWFFASDDTYLGKHLIPLVRPGGQYGAVLPGFRKEIAADFPANLPAHLEKYWDSCALAAWHSADWWRQHWLKAGGVNVTLADDFPDDEGYQTYLRWEQIMAYDERLAEEDAGRNVTFVRLAARRKI